MTTAAINPATLKIVRTAAAMSISPSLVTGSYRPVKRRVYCALPTCFVDQLSKDHSRYDLGHRGRFVRAVELNRLPHGQVNRGLIDLFGVDEFGSQTDSAARLNRRQKSHLVEPIVDTHLRVVDTVVVPAQRRNERQCQEAVCDCCAIRTFGPGPLDVDVNPLMIVGGVGKCIYAFLVYGDPFGDAQFLAYGLDALIDR